MRHSSAEQLPVRPARVEQTRTRTKDIRGLMLGWFALVLVCLYLIFLYPALAAPEAGYDFHLYYLTGQAALHGANMYDPASLASFNTAQGLGAEADHYIYPPPFLLLILPFALLPWNLAWPLWIGLNVVAWLLSLRLLMLAVGLQLHGRELLLFPAAVLAPFPLYRVLFLGQVGLLTLLMLATCFYCWRKQHQLSAGAALAIAGMIKLTPFGIGLVFLFWRSQRLIAGLILTLVAGLALVCVCFGPAPLFDFPRYLLGGLDQKVAYSFNGAPAALWTRLFTLNKWTDPLIVAPSLAQLLNYITTAAICLATVFGVAHLKQGTALHQPTMLQQSYAETGFDIAFSLCVTAVMLVVPLAWEHHLVLLYLPAILIGAALRHEPKMRGGWSWLFWISLALLALPPFFISFFAASRSPLLLSCYSYCLFAVWLAQLGIALRYRNRRSELEGVSQLRSGESRMGSGA